MFTGKIYRNKPLELEREACLTELAPSKKDLRKVALQQRRSFPTDNSNRPSPAPSNFSTTKMSGRSPKQPNGAMPENTLNAVKEG